MTNYKNCFIILLLSIILVIAGYEFTCGGLLVVYYKDYSTAIYYLLKGFLLTLCFLLIDFRKEVIVVFHKDKSSI